VAAAVVRGAGAAVARGARHKAAGYIATSRGARGGTSVGGAETQAVIALTMADAGQVWRRLP
jgi:hypothetical protein